MSAGGHAAVGARALRDPAVAGSFYPAGRAELERTVAALLGEADRRAAGRVDLIDPDLLLGILVPHAGLVYSGAVAAAAWRLLRPVAPGRESTPTVVILGTNHVAGWLQGVGAWERGAWRTPVADLAVDEELAGAIVDLGAPFRVDRAAHQGEHSIEVQLPLLGDVARGARIVPLAVSAGIGPAAIAAGERLGTLLGQRRRAGDRVVLAISSDMAHYPPARIATEVTERLAAPIVALDPGSLAAEDRAVQLAGAAGLVCGMCGIEPTVLGLAALRTMGAVPGVVLDAATSADAGGPADRTVGYLAVAFPG